MTGRTRVVNIRSGEPYDVYIGRGRCPKTGRKSKWGNPYSDKPSGIPDTIMVATRDEAIQQYGRYIYTVGLDRDLAEIRGKVLGCWCAPTRCHGDLLSALADGKKLRILTSQQFREGYAVLPSPVDSSDPDAEVVYEHRKYKLLYKDPAGRYIVEEPDDTQDLS